MLEVAATAGPDAHTPREDSTHRPPNCSSLRPSSRCPRRLGLTRSHLVRTLLDRKATTAICSALAGRPKNNACLGADDGAQDPTRLSCRLSLLIRLQGRRPALRPTACATPYVDFWYACRAGGQGRGQRADGLRYKPCVHSWYACKAGGQGWGPPAWPQLKVTPFPRRPALQTLCS